MPPWVGSGYAIAPLRFGNKQGACSLAQWSFGPQGSWSSPLSPPSPDWSRALRAIRASWTTVPSSGMYSALRRTLAPENGSKPPRQRQLRTKSCRSDLFPLERAKRGLQNGFCGENGPLGSPRRRDRRSGRASGLSESHKKRRKSNDRAPRHISTRVARRPHWGFGRVVPIVRHR